MSPLVNVFVFVPLSIGLLLWFCFLPERGSGAQRPGRRTGPADPAAEDRLE
jgi:hypothetical protein